jgi:hypothetical protein
MATPNRPLVLASLLAVIALVASCNPFTAASPSQTVCGGVSSEVGGCTAERHEFTGETCDALAEEWAGALDKAILAVLTGPEVVADQGRSVRIRQALVITTTDMNARLHALGLRDNCDVEEFMATAEPAFSPELRAGVGNALYDGAPPATYEEWIQDVENVARMIDDGE